MAGKFIEKEIDDGLVEIQAPMGKPNEQDLIIGLNGVNYSIPKDGKKHRVKPGVAFEFNRSMEDEMKFYQKQAALQEQSIFV